jgi:hypothetical protein
MPVSSKLKHGEQRAEQKSSNNGVTINFSVLYWICYKQDI